MSKKYLFILSLITLIVLTVGGFIYSSSQVNNDEIFRNYITKFADLNSLAENEIFEGTGSKMSGRGVFDLTKKEIKLSADVACSANVNNNPINIESTLLQYNEKNYIRLNNIQGTIQDENGQPIKLDEVYSKVKDAWYVVTEEDKAIKSMIDNGVYVLDSALIAPESDSQKIADTLIEKKAYTYTDIKKSDDNYLIKFQSHRTEYGDALKELFPGLSSTDLILDLIFDDKDSIESTITVNKEGKFLGQRLTEDNYCKDVFSAYTGEEPDGLASNLAGENTPVSADTVLIPSVQNAKPISGMAEDISL